MCGANKVKAGWSSAAWMNTIGPSTASRLPCVANPLQQGDVEQDAAHQLVEVGMATTGSLQMDKPARRSQFQF
jgi:hypothetical protein